MDKMSPPLRDDRQAKLAQALRENLRRRKAVKASGAGGKTNSPASEE